MAMYDNIITTIYTYLKLFLAQNYFLIQSAGRNKQ